MLGCGKGPSGDKDGLRFAVSLAAPSHLSIYVSFRVPGGSPKYASSLLSALIICSQATLQLLACR